MGGERTKWLEPELGVEVKVGDDSAEHVRRASVGKGWLVYIGIHQLSRCVRVMGTTSVTFGEESFKYGKEEN